MFIGHFGTGFAVKKIAPQPSLGTLFFAAQFIDLLWPILLLLGLEKVQIDPGNTAVTPLNFEHYPISHSMFGVLIWALLFGVVYYLIKKNTLNAIWLGLLVFSHWLLDLFTHRPDLPLFPWTDKMVGFGLWNSVVGTMILELSIFGIGLYFYLSITKPKNKKGIVGLWLLIVFLIVIYLSNIFGPPPPKAEPIAYLGLAQWLLIIWAYWIDKNREIKIKYS
jgi:membrane-bound metal-dependent hydrolase YbcI (DUF457 family)